MKTLAALVSVVLLASPAFADGVTLDVKEAFLSRSVGGKNEKHTPAIGEPYRLTVKFEVTGQPVADYQVLFELGGLKKTVTLSKGAAGPREASHSFGSLPLDGPIPYRIEVDPTGAARGGPGAGGGSRAVAWIFEPVPPTKAIVYSDPKLITGSQRAEIDWKAGGTIDRIDLMMGQPATDSWQKLVTSSATISLGGQTTKLNPLEVGADRFWPLWFWEKKSIAPQKIVLEQKFLVQVKNQRVNRDELLEATWAKVDGLQPIDVLRFYTQPDDVIQSKDPKVGAFVKAALGGSDYRSRMRPYRAARMLYKAVLKHLTYTYPKEGEPDLRGHSAVALIDGGMGDCGGFSMLIVACLRNVGIPARTACGGWVGGYGHCWSEFFVPGGGWVICDGSAGNSFSEDGTFAYCFGNNFDLNERMAFMRGNSFTVNDVHTAWLQGPMYPWLWGSAKIDAWTPDWEIEHPEFNLSGLGGAGDGAAQGKQSAPAPGSSPSRRTRAPRELVMRADDDERRGGCPCEKHGGLRLRPKQLLQLRPQPK